jgi:hypothetical protein
MRKSAQTSHPIKTHFSHNRILCRKGVPRKNNSLAPKKMISGQKIYRSVEKATSACTRRKPPDLNKKTGRHQDDRP